MHPTLTIAKRAALAAGKVLLRYQDRLERLKVSQKGAHDLVSEVDLQAEAEIIRTLRHIYPDHAILAEESGRSGENEFEWVIDPLDGTTNYLHGFPHYAISIALRQQGRLVSGVVYDPLRQEIFTASKGDGARLNDRRIRVRGASVLEESLIGTGFPFRHPRYREAYLAALGELFGRCREIRRAGSAALDLAYVAAGRLDGYFELGLAPWDSAAGALLVQEAGGLVGDLEGGHRFLDTGQIVAGNPRIFKALLQQLHGQLGGLAGK